MNAEEFARKIFAKIAKDIAPSISWDIISDIERQVFTGWTKTALEVLEDEGMLCPREHDGLEKVMMHVMNGKFEPYPFPDQLGQDVAAIAFAWNKLIETRK